MALAPFTGVAFSVLSGVAVAPGASVEVRRRDTGALASIFIDEDGAQPLANPFQADAKGRFRIYVAGLLRGYRIIVANDTDDEAELHVSIGTAGQVDVTSFMAGVLSAADGGAARSSLGAQAALDGATFEALVEAMFDTLTEETALIPSQDYVLIARDESDHVGKKVPLSRLGAWERIQVQTVSDVAAVDFTLPVGYEFYRLDIIEAKPVSDAVHAWVRFSDDDGATFEADAGDYSWQSNGSASSSVEANTSDAELQLTGTSGNVGNATGERISASVYIYGALSADKTTVFAVGFTNLAADGVPRLVFFTGHMITASTDEAVRFLFSSGNIASGKFILSGMKST